MEPMQYASCAYAQRDTLVNIIDEFADELKEISGKCIDIGCGPGNITKEILLPSLHINATMIGVDILEDMIKYANTNYSEEKRLVFKKLDLQTKNLPKKYLSEFDHVFSIYTFHWCNDIQRAFKNVYHMLRPGGTMLILMMSMHDIFDILKFISTDDRYSSYLSNIQNIWPIKHSIESSNRHMKELLRNIGFKVYQCSHRDRAQHKDIYNSLEGTVGFLKLFLDKIPQDKRNEFYSLFKQEYVKKIARQPHVDQNKMSVTIDIHKLLVIYAGKTQDLPKMITLSNSEQTKLIIVPIDYPNIKLNNDNISELKKMIKRSMLDPINNVQTLLFNNFLEREGAIIFYCANKQTVEWMISLTSKFTLKGGIQLRALHDDNLFDCHKNVKHQHHIIVHVPDSNVSIKEILTFLDKQNESLITDEWIIAEGSEKRDTTGVYFGSLIDCNSLKVLEAANFKVSCGLTQATVRLVL